MISFLPYRSFEESAKCLDYKRLGKMRVECLQILKTLNQGPFLECWHECGLKRPKGHRESDGIVYCNNCGTPLRNTPWCRHPAVQMWRGYEYNLANYGIIFCQEWIKRGYKDTTLKRISDIREYLDYKEDSYPWWLGFEKFHSSHRAALLYKNFIHYSQFGWDEKPELNYCWPRN